MIKSGYWDENISKEYKEYLIKDLLDTYEPVYFNKHLYQLLNYEEKGYVFDSEYQIKLLENKTDEMSDFMDLADIQLEKEELVIYEKDRMEVYHDYV